MRWFPLALVLCASFASAQSDAGQNAIRVEGTTLSVNGYLVPKATVGLQGTGGQPGQPPVSYIETTDNEGKFVFEDVAPGRYMLSAVKPGFITTRYGARSNTSPGTQFNLTAGMELKDLVVKMTPQGVIAGKVMDQDGDPVVTQVQAWRNTYLRGRKQLVPAGSGIVNNRGEYRLSNLAPGRYYISASDRRVVSSITAERAGRSGGVQEGNITTYYPNGTDASTAAPVDVAAGGEIRGIDIRLLRAKVYTVRGKAASASGVPAQVLVAFVRKEEGSAGLPVTLNGGSITQLRPGGSFEFRNIVPGTYVLQVVQADANGNAPANLTGRVEVTVADANIDNLVLPLGPGPEITGTVRLEDGDIATLAPLLRFTLSLTETEGVPIGSPNAQVKDDGTFRFNVVGTRKYVLNAISLPSGTYLKSARFGGQDVTHSPFDTTSGAGGTLDIVLSSKAADVSGSVQNKRGEALAGVIVTLWPKTPDATLTGGARQAFTDQNGGFEFKGLAPGDYYVAAWEELESGLATSTDFLTHFTSDASAIKLAEGAHESRDLKPVPSDKIAVEIAKLP